MLVPIYTYKPSMPWYSYIRICSSPKSVHAGGGDQVGHVLQVITPDCSLKSWTYLLHDIQPLSSMVAVRGSATYLNSSSRCQSKSSSNISKMWYAKERKGAALNGSIQPLQSSHRGCILLIQQILFTYDQNKAAWCKMFLSIHCQDASLLYKLIWW